MVKLTEIPLVTLFLVVGGLTLGIGATVLQTYYSSIPGGDNTTAGRAVLNVSSGIGNFAAQFPNIGLILALGAIVAVLMGAVAYFSVKRGPERR